MWVEVLRLLFEVLKEITSFNKSNRAEVAIRQLSQEIVSKNQLTYNRINDLDQKLSYVLTQIHKINDPKLIVQQQNIIIEKPESIDKSLFFTTLYEKAILRLDPPASTITKLEQIGQFQLILHSIISVEPIEWIGIKNCIEKQVVKHVDFVAIHSKSESKQLRIEFLYENIPNKVYFNKKISNLPIRDLMSEINSFARVYCNNNVQCYFSLHEFVRRELLINEFKFPPQLLIP